MGRLTRQEVINAEPYRKRCNKCGELKWNDEFPVTLRNADGRSVVCSECYKKRYQLAKAVRNL